MTRPAKPLPQAYVDAMLKSVAEGDRSILWWSRRLGISYDRAKRIVRRAGVRLPPEAPGYVAQNVNGPALAAVAQSRHAAKRAELRRMAEASASLRVLFGALREEDVPAYVEEQVRICTNPRNRPKRRKPPAKKPPAKKPLAKKPRAKEGQS